MHPMIKKIIKKNSVYAILGVILQVGAVICMLKATLGTVKEIKGTVKKALDQYTEQ